MKPGDLVRFDNPVADKDGQPVEDNATYTVSSIKDGIAYFDEGYWPVSGLVLVAEYTDLDGGE